MVKANHDLESSTAKYREKCLLIGDLLAKFEV